MDQNDREMNLTILTLFIAASKRLDAPPIIPKSTESDSDGAR
jgi:hypothetical protein